MRLVVNTLRSATICWVVVLIGAQNLVADEPAARFVDALRDKGYYDIALEYLEKAKNNPNVAEDYRKRIKFVKATVMIDQVGQLRERKKIDAQLDTAQRLLKEYAADNKSLVESARTFQFRSRLLSTRADVSLRDADAKQLTEGEREKIREEARGYLEESLKSANGAYEAVKRLLGRNSKEGIKIKAGDSEALELAREMKGVFRKMSVHRPFIAERMASTFPERSPERKGLLNSAIDTYKKDVIDSNSSGEIAKVEANLRAGICSQQLGEHDQALDFFKQVMFNRQPGIGSLQKQALAAAADSWQESKEYPTRSVISQLEPVVENLTRNDKRDPVWLRVMLELGIAKYELSKIVKDEGDTVKSKKVLREAGRLLREITRIRNPHRDRAKKLLEKWNVPLIEPADVAEEPTKEIKSFADAFEVGNDEMSNIDLLASELRQASADLKAASEPEQAKLAADVKELEKRLREETDKTIALFNTAMSLVNSDTSIDEINSCRFFQCYCYFVTDRHLEVSVIGQYLLQQYPNANRTRPTVGLLLQSRKAAYIAAPADGNAVELQLLKNTALEVVKQWPGSAEADRAISELVGIELRAGNLPQAVELMDRLPESSAQRPQLSARVGKQLWHAYKVAAKSPETRNNTDELNKKIEQALPFLEAGVSTADSSKISFSEAVTGLNLVDAWLTKGEAERALEMLGSPSGPAEVIKSASPAVFGNPKAAQYKRDAYSLMIKTYLGMLATTNAQQQWQEWLGKCEGLIRLMEQEVQASQTEDAKRQLSASYHLISAELKKRFDVTTDQKKRLQVARALAELLPSIEKNSSANGRILLTVGSTMVGMATTIAESGDLEKAKPLFDKALRALDSAERLGFAGDPKEAALKLGLSRQRALAQRGAGQYGKSVKTFIEILKAPKSSLTIQLDAAATLQQWGKVGALSTKYTLAVNGTGRNNRPTNAIWGWSKILRLTQGDKAKYRDQYYTAAYGIAEAIYEQGKLNKKDGRKRALARIEREKSASPDFLGSQAWKQKFSELEKRIKSGR